MLDLLVASTRAHTFRAAFYPFGNFRLGFVVNFVLDVQPSEPLAIQPPPEVVDRFTSRKGHMAMYDRNVRVSWGTTLTLEIGLASYSGTGATSCMTHESPSTWENLAIRAFYDEPPEDACLALSCQTVSCHVFFCHFWACPVMLRS